MKKIVLLQVAVLNLVTVHAKDWRFYDRNGGYQGRSGK